MVDLPYIRGIWLHVLSALKFFLKKRNGERYGRIEDTGAELHESLIEKEPIPDSWQYRHVLKAGSRTLHVVLVNMGNRKPDMDT